jgi:hypothetical protein
MSGEGEVAAAAAVAVAVVEGEVEVEAVVEEGVGGEVEVGRKATETERKSQNGKSRSFFVGLKPRRTIFRRGSRRRKFLRRRLRDRPCPLLPRCSRRQI